MPVLFPRVPPALAGLAILVAGCAREPAPEPVVLTAPDPAPVITKDGIVVPADPVVVR